MITELQSGSVRVGDAERQEVVALLGGHAAAGRLDLAEYDERVVAAYAARTRADLVPLLADLPAEGQRQERVRRQPGPALVPAMLLVVVAVAIAFMVTTGFPPFFLVPALFFAHARHRSGHRPLGRPHHHHR